MEPYIAPATKVKKNYRVWLSGCQMQMQQMQKLMMSCDKIVLLKMTTTINHLDFVSQPNFVKLLSYKIMYLNMTFSDIWMAIYLYLALSSTGITNP